MRRKKAQRLSFQNQELVGHKVIADFYFYEKVNSFKKEF